MNIKWFKVVRSYQH